ncbi:hypothetical protein CDAR_285821 [Caerostris darwini]|uniref:Uncharacterized protein n=1 Tax=Caerostris darwini TaxID=1538125 RepID=A0AAV4SX87_9ARAC|nr:hypothetical protein CDAR_285821 [Caerostris darwini]
MEHAKEPPLTVLQVSQKWAESLYKWAHKKTSLVWMRTILSGIIPFSNIAFTEIQYKGVKVFEFHLKAGVGSNTNLRHRMKILGTISNDKQKTRCRKQNLNLNSPDIILEGKNNSGRISPGFLLSNIQVFLVASDVLFYF